MTQFNPNMPIDEQAELLPYDAEWEFPKERLILGQWTVTGAPKCLFGQEMTPISKIFSTLTSDLLYMNFLLSTDAFTFVTAIPEVPICDCHTPQSTS